MEHEGLANNLAEAPNRCEAVFFFLTIFLASEDGIMALDDLFFAFQSFVEQLRDGFCPEAVARQQEEDVKQLKRESQERCHQLFRQRRDVEKMRQRVAEQEKQAASLPLQIEAHVLAGDKKNAWQAAMELDRVRNNLAIDRERLRHFEQVYDEQVKRLEKINSELEELSVRRPRLASV